MLNPKWPMLYALRWATHPYTPFICLSNSLTWQTRPIPSYRISLVTVSSSFSISIFNNNPITIIMCANNGLSSNKYKSVRRPRPDQFQNIPQLPYLGGAFLSFYLLLFLFVNPMPPEWLINWLDRHAHHTNRCCFGSFCLSIVWSTSTTILSLSVSKLCLHFEFLYFYCINRYILCQISCLIYVFCPFLLICFRY